MMLARVVALAFAVPATAAPFSGPTDLGDGVHVFFGARDLPNRDNRGHVANQAFIVAAAGVVVIDSGTNAKFADHMLRAIRARTAKPLAAVILTRPADDAIFGATALQRHGAAVVAHEAAAKLIAERCAVCLESLRRTLGEDEMAGTTLPRPDRVFTGTRTLVIAGRSLTLIDYSGAAAPGSIAVWDAASGILFAGGLASFERLPETRDGDLPAWTNALEDLAARPARAIVPAHGPAGGRPQLAEVKSYLRALDRGTARAYAARVSLLDAPRSVAVDAYRGWALYDVLHPRNVHHAYLARERGELAKP